MQPQRKQALLLDTVEREKLCTNRTHFPYRGRIPCTGPQSCPYCGELKSEHNPRPYEAVGPHFSIEYVGNGEYIVFRFRHFRPNHWTKIALTNPNTLAYSLSVLDKVAKHS